MKKLLSACLFIALMAASGCSYSWEHTTQTSAGVNSDGKIEVGASSNVYSEKVENGKTTNNKAAFAVGNSSPKSSNEKFDVALKYTIEDADLRAGETEIFGYFMNEGKNPATIHNVKLSFTATDDKGKVIWEDGGEFKNLNLTVQPGQDLTHDFVVKNNRAPAYNGSFNLNYTISYD